MARSAGIGSGRFHSLRIGASRERKTAKELPRDDGRCRAPRTGASRKPRAAEPAAVVRAETQTSARTGAASHAAGRVARADPRRGRSHLEQ